MAKKRKTTHGWFDVYDIIWQLDKKTGMNFRDLEVKVQYEEEDDDDMDNTLAYCEITRIKKESAIEIWERNMSDEENNELLIQKIQNAKDNEELKTFAYPTGFMFSNKALCLTYETLREIVIHEYAHALVAERCFKENRETEENVHGEEFQRAVIELGGKAVSAYASQEEDYNVYEYRRAEELAKQHEFPYAVHILQHDVLDGERTDSHAYTIVRRKTNCKAIKTCVDNLKDNEFAKVISVNEVGHKVGKEIFIEIEFDLDKIIASVE